MKHQFFFGGGIKTIKGLFAKWESGLFLCRLKAAKDLSVEWLMKLGFFAELKILNDCLQKIKWLIFLCRLKSTKGLSAKWESD